MKTMTLVPIGPEKSAPIPASILESAVKLIGHIDDSISEICIKDSKSGRSFRLVNEKEEVK